MTRITDASELGTLKKAAVIDDRKNFRDMYTRFFEDAGFSVQTADSFQSGSKLIEREFFHVAAVDLSLYGERNQDGLRIIDRIYKDLKEGTETILLSAYGTMEIGAEAKDLGAFAVIEKENVNPAEFGGLVERAYQKAADSISRYHVAFNFLGGPGEPTPTYIWTTNSMQTLNAGGFDYVDSFTKRLLMHLYPLLRYSSGPQADLDQNKRLVKGLYWSKMIGYPIIVEIGPPEVIRKEQEAFEQAAKATEGQRESVLRVLMEKKLAGLVVSSTKPERDAFELCHDIEVRYPRP